jgi:hypothetical protein
MCVCVLFKYVINSKESDLQESCVVWVIIMGWDYVSELLPPADILLIPQMTWLGERRWNDILAGKPEKTRKKNRSTTNPTWIYPGANPGISGERPATNRLSHGSARFIR